MKSKEDKLKLLKETVAHFNLGNRSTNSPIENMAERCLYSGKGCAIGRLIEDKEQQVK